MTEYIDVQWNRDLYDIRGYLSRHIGYGLAMPETFVYGSTAVNDLLRRINQSIYVILVTAKGERFFRPDFGSNLKFLIFDPMDDVCVEMLKVEVGDAIKTWEKRIEVFGVDIMASEQFVNNNMVGVLIKYKVKGFSVVGNYVYPYYYQGQPM